MSFHVPVPLHWHSHSFDREAGDESTTVPRAVNPASNPLAAPVRDRHPSRGAWSGLRDTLEPLAWGVLAACAITGWIALVYAVGA